MRNLIVGVVALGLALGSRQARADDRAHVRLEYSGSAAVEECPDEQELRRAISERAGYDPILPSAADAIVVTLNREAERISRVDLLDPSGAVLGTRRLGARDGGCGEPLEAVALSVGIAVDRIERRAAAPPPEPPPTPSPQPPTETPAR